MEFDNWSLVDLVKHPAVSRLRGAAAAEARHQVEANMGDDLSLPPCSGVPSGIHVPALAGLAQGPGMPNLGCLGLVAARILQPYSA